MCNMDSLPTTLRSAAADSGAASALQSLLAPILRAAHQRAFRHLMLVGAARGVGTSLVARQAAAELAPAFGQVLLLEVGPVVAANDHKTLALAEAIPAGSEQATEVWYRRIALDACLRAFSAGGPGQLPPALERFDLVLWDVPPPTSSPVSLLMSAHMDGIVLIAQAHRTRRQVAGYVAERLRASGGHVLGVILNRTVNFIPEWLYRWL